MVLIFFAHCIGVVWCVWLGCQVLFGLIGLVLISVSSVDQWGVVLCAFLQCVCWAVLAGWWHNSGASGSGRKFPTLTCWPAPCTPSLTSTLAADDEDKWWVQKAPFTKSFSRPLLLGGRVAFLRMVKLMVRMLVTCSDFPNCDRSLWVVFKLVSRGSSYHHTSYCEQTLLVANSVRSCVKYGTLGFCSD